MTPEPTWQLAGFHHHMQAWVSRDTPPAEFVGAAGDWLGVLAVDPRRNARRQADLGAGFWFAKVPGASDGKQTVVSLYEIDEFHRVVTCHSIASLREPII